MGRADEILAFLAGRHGEPVTDLEPLSGGYWSNAYGYRVGDRALVLRLGEMREGFEDDRIAMGYAGPGLPVPAVIEIGEGLGAGYAISQRHHGRFLEDVGVAEAAVTGPTLIRLLAALRGAPCDPAAGTAIGPPHVQALPGAGEAAVDAPTPGGRAPDGSGPDGSTRDDTWRGWLRRGLVDDPARPVRGWRATLARDPALDRLFRACEDRIDDLLPACPERRDLVHGDLLHQNVLISPDGTEVAAVFSWKCAVHGDFLLDTAWCTFWSPWHPGIGAIDVWSRQHAALFVDPALPLDPALLVDAALRHHCYELWIGATHLAWMAFTDDAAQLAAVAAHTSLVLERGPLPTPRAGIDDRAIGVNAPDPSPPPEVVFAVDGPGRSIARSEFVTLSPATATRVVTRVERPPSELCPSFRATARPVD